MSAKHRLADNRYYSDHLNLKKPLPYQSYIRVPSSQPRHIPHQGEYKTNYNITLRNPYAFILLHLKKMPTTKNKLFINIPEVAIFQSGKAFDIVYSDNGDIKGPNRGESIRLNDIYTTFRQRSKVKRQEMSFAFFQNNVNGKNEQECLLLSDTDLLIICRKFKTDPFFRKLQYLKNKLQVDYQLQSQFDAQRDHEFSGEAASCFLGSVNDDHMLASLGQQKYLQYCNKKIAMFLNYEHNIRIYNCKFYYSKTINNQYYLTNIKELKFTNLTKSLFDRQNRLKLREEERNKILIMTPQKYAKYRSLENSSNVSIIEKEMNGQVYRIADKLKIQTNTDRIKEQQKTDEAFKKLYSNFSGDLKSAINDHNFVDLRKTLMQSSKRKSLCKPSKYMTKFMKLQQKVRSTFDSFDSVHSTH